MRILATILGSVAVCSIVWAGGMEAWAQVDLDPEAPTCVEEEQTSVVYQATVRTNYNFDFRLKVYLNGNLEHDSTTVVTQSGPSYNFSKTVDMTGWDQLEGDTMDFTGRATLTSGSPGTYDEANILIDPVEGEGSCFVPSVPLPGRKVPEPGDLYREGIRDRMRIRFA